jgi:hypothetical protein
MFSLDGRGVLIPAIFFANIYDENYL